MKRMNPVERVFGVAARSAGGRWWLAGWVVLLLPLGLLATGAGVGSSVARAADGVEAELDTATLDTDAAEEGVPARTPRVAARILAEKKERKEDDEEAGLLERRRERRAAGDRVDRDRRLAPREERVRERRGEDREGLLERIRERREAAREESPDDGGLLERRAERVRERRDGREDREGLLERRRERREADDRRDRTRVGERRRAQPGAEARREMVRRPDFRRPGMAGPRPDFARRPDFRRPGFDRRPDFRRPGFDRFPPARRDAVRDDAALLRALADLRRSVDALRDEVRDLRSERGRGLRGERRPGERRTGERPLLERLRNRLSEAMESTEGRLRFERDPEDGRVRIELQAEEREPGEARRVRNGIERREARRDPLATDQPRRVFPNLRNVLLGFQDGLVQLSAEAEDGTRPAIEVEVVSDEPPTRVRVIAAEATRAVGRLIEENRRTAHYPDEKPRHADEEQDPALGSDVLLVPDEEPRHPDEEQGQSF